LPNVEVVTSWANAHDIDKININDTFLT
jgi:hypothetical protein